MVLVDGPALILVACALVAAIISGKSRDTSLLVINAIILPAGLTTTFIGAVHMLHSLEDPSALGPATAVALLSVVYTAAVKICIEVYLSKRTTQAKISHGKRGWAGATVWCAGLLGAILVFDGHFLGFFNLPAAIFIGLSLAAIAGVTKAAGSKSYLHQIVRYIPSAGLFILYASAVTLLANWQDPSAIGPIIAIGFLGYLYASVLYTVLILIRPETMPRGPQTSQWLHWAGSLGGFAFYFVITLLAIQ